MKQVRGYIFSREFMGERVPQHVQNLVIRDFCQKNGLAYLLSATEYAMQGCQLILDQVLGDLDDISGIAAYSLYQLPTDELKRSVVYDRILSQKKTIYFAVEGLRLESAEDVERIETLWKVRTTLPNCYKAQEQEWKN